MTGIKSGRGRVASFEYVESEGKSIFSKGPWKWYEDISGDKIGVSDAEGSDVLCVNHSEGIVIPREKDASLMVAAPDLYAALSLFMEYNELMDAGDDVAGMLKYAELMEVAPKALAKARGES